MFFQNSNHVNVLCNCCFKFRSKVSQQVIAIPMGSDLAAFMENLFPFSLRGEMGIENRET